VAKLETLTFSNRLKKAYDGFFSSGETSSRGLIAEINEPIDGVSLGGNKISVDSLFTVWRNSSDVFACVRELKENIGSAGYIWLNKRDSNVEPNKAEVEKIESILNYNRTFRRLKAKIIQFERITGNAYLLIVKTTGGDKPIGFDVIDPRTMSVVVDQYGTIIKWLQRVKGNVQEYQPNEILHYKTDDDPNSSVFGLSPLEPVIWEARSDLSAMISNYALHANDSVPGAQYILDDSLSDEQKVKVTDSIKAQLKGPENKHKSISVQGVKEIKTIGLSPKDMEFISQRKFTTEKICSAYGVPKSILGYIDDVNLANGQEQTKKLWEGTISPAQENFAEFINQVMLPALGINDIMIEFKTREFDDREWNEASTRADLEHGILTVNEVRALRDYDEYDESKEGEWVNKPLLWNGGTIKPLEDVGLELDEFGVPAILNEDQAAKEISKIEQIKKRNQYGKSGKDTTNS
jgi:HK97 family phage portal protein